MTVASIYAIKDHYDAQAAAECAAGRGQDLMLAFARDIGADFARTTFLRMSAIADEVTAKNAQTTFELLNSFPQYAMNQLADAVRTGWIVEAGLAAGPELDDVEKTAVESFAATLEMLFASSHGGGAA